MLNHSAISTLLVLSGRIHWTQCGVCENIILAAWMSRILRSQFRSHPDIYPQMVERHVLVEWHVLVECKAVSRVES